MGLPLTVYPGTYTPGAETALHAAVDVINETWAQANIKLAAFETKIQAITDLTSGWLNTISSPHVPAQNQVSGSVVEPVVNIPTNIDTTMIYADYATQYTALRALMTNDLPKIFTDYFPNNGTTYAAAETWVQQAMANPNSALPAAVQAQILSDDHARIIADANRASNAIEAKFAGMRFPTPPGAMLSAQLQIQQRRQDLMAESSRKITMQVVDMMKWAIDEAMKMRTLAMGSALDWTKTMVSGPSEASKVIGVGIDAQSKLIGAVSSYYSARTAAVDLSTKASEFNVSTSLQVAEKNQMADLTMIEDRLKALLMECQAFAQMATAMFNNLHASTGTSYGVNVS